MASKIKMGVLCPASIARRRFMPSLQKCSGFEYIGVAHADERERFLQGEPHQHAVLERGKEKAEIFCSDFGGIVFDSYQSMIDSNLIDAVYIPLPPALHFMWAEKALSAGKHVFLEKPSTTRLTDTCFLVELARKNQLAIHENYMFQFHRQMETVFRLISEGHIGDLQLIRIAFGFPMRAKDDFRYNKELGGGALLDCGGYALKLATMILGEDIRLQDAKLLFCDQGVDIAGNGVLRNSNGLTAQIAFGMNHQYKCELEIWGSTGILKADRIFTAPPDLEMNLMLYSGNRKEYIPVAADDQFYGSICYFEKCIHDLTYQKRAEEEMLRQSALVEEFRKLCYA